MTKKNGKNVITGVQIRAARAMLGWSAMELAERTGVARNTIQRLESFEDVPPSRTQSLLEIRQVLAEAGITFIDADDQHGAGVRMTKLM